MESGYETRVQVDNFTVKALLLLNGGGAVALLALIPSVIGKPELKALSYGIMWALLFFQFGLVSCVIHNLYRRKCSLEYEKHNGAPPAGNYLSFNLNKPTVCFLQELFMWISLSLFILAGLTVFAGGIYTVLCNGNQAFFTSV